MAATVIKDGCEQYGRFYQSLEKHIKTVISTLYIVNIEHISKLPINLCNITSFNPIE